MSFSPNETTEPDAMFPSRATTPPNLPAPTTNVSTTTAHANFVLPPAGTYGVAQLPMGPPSPNRNPTTTGSTNGMYSVNADGDRSQLRNELQNRVHYINARKPNNNNFWEEILSTHTVSEDTVTGIRSEIQNEINLLCRLAKRKNPLEEDMYPPLTRIFEAIKPGDHTRKRTTRFWKDHHTQYPGVDPEVLISGLHAPGELAEGNSMTDESANSQVPYKIRKIGTERVATRSPSAGASEDNDGHDPRSEDGEYKRKVISKPGTTQRVADIRKPDWILLDADSAGMVPANPLWRHIAVIFELKAEVSMVPKERKLISSLIVQCADYARLHLALRPFQRFTIHFSLCGNLFNAWLIDRAGVIISETVDIAKKEGADTFIRALVQVTTDLTMYELGMDPTVTVGEGSCLGDEKIPRFEVKMPSGNSYTTKGPPIWQSSSLFGRGTIVWKVEEGAVPKEESQTKVQPVSTRETSIADPRGVQGAIVANLPDNSDTLAAEPEGQSAHPASDLQERPDSSTANLEDKPELILKSAYHRPERIAESKFYEAINQAKHPGIAIFLEGGDIVYNMEKVTTATHRHDLTPSDQDPVAHRLVLKSKGRRLTECKSILELLEAILASVRGHEALFNHGIIHRDISIGNVFISDDPDRTPGFLGDLDMAKVYDADKLARLVGREKAEEMVRTTGQGSITGTAQFMSLSLLDHYTSLQEDQRFKGSIVHRARSDFQWRPSRFGAIKETRMETVKSDSTLKYTPGNDSQHNLHSSSGPVPESPRNGGSGLKPDQKNDIDWELAARNDLESFIWVMLYALCAQEMSLKPLKRGQDGREWHCRELFMPLFGGVSFQRTAADHLSAAGYILRDNARLTLKEALIPMRRYWDILCDLLQCATSSELNHTTFQEMLMHYIGEEKRYMEAQDNS